MPLPRFPSSIIAASLAVLAILPLGGCDGSADSSALGVAFIGRPEDPFATGVRLPPAGQLIRAATTEGLVAFDEQGRVTPALADRWIVTDDGQSYIFRLRDGNWTNGDPITADSTRKALMAALKNLDGTPLGRDLDGIEEIRTMAGRVIEIRLDRPMPYLLQLLAQPELGLAYKQQGAGPMSLQRGRALATLTPIDPARLGLPTVEDWAADNRPVRLRALPGAEAVAAFNDGDVDLVLGGRIQDFPLTRSVGILRGTIQLDPVVGLFGLQVMNERGFLNSPRNREALAMAIDREALIEPFRVGGWAPTTRVVTPSIEGELGNQPERWADQTIEQRRGVAASHVRAWRQSEGASAGAGAGTGNGTGPVLRVALPEGEGSRLLFGRLSADFAAIGVTLERSAEGQPADLALVDDVARYPRTSWFLNRLSCQARRGLCSADADALVAEAGRSGAPSTRAVLLAQAEAQLTAANVFIPFGAPIRWSLVRGSVGGFAPNPWGWHPLMPLSRLTN